ncbi:UNVERIFIED_CONTAM: hypothetical protein Sradi_3794900 [Sesamum radiatum]|uniref:Uncharacterized protein n=1 Tax=Sesamum radiatum TaxID=300843 RepID=A0AAW2PZS6_SESRA
MESACCASAWHARGGGIRYRHQGALRCFCGKSQMHIQVRDRGNSRGGGTWHARGEGMGQTRGADARGQGKDVNCFCGRGPDMRR